MKTGEYLLAEEKVGRAVAKLALPAVLTTIVSMIYNFTDTFFIGLLRDTEQLSALSLAMPLMWLVSTIAGVIGAGAPQVISLKMGAGDGEGAKRAASFCVFGSLLLGLLVTPVSLLLLRPALSLMGAQGMVMEYAAQYLEIIVGATAISALSGAMQGVLRAQGRAALSSIGSAVGIVLNIALDPLFILVFDMGVRGAAIATVLGSLASLVFCIVVIRGHVGIRHALPDGETARQVFALSLSSSVTGVLNSLIVGFSFSMATGFGNEVVAAISVGSKLYSFLCSLVSALAFSLQPFVGYTYAANAFPRLKKGLLTSLSLGTAVCLLGTAAFLTLGGPYMRLFTDDPEVIRAGEKMIRFLAIGAPVVALNMTAMMLLSATGKAMRSLIAGLGRQIIIFIPLMLILRRFFGMEGLILSYPITDIAAAVLAVGLCWKDARRILRAA